MDSTTTVFRDGTVLAGRDLAPTPCSSLVLRDGRIDGIDVPAPAGAATVDASGLLLIPGFVDAHVHIGFADPAEVVRGGVTTVRDLGWPEDAIFPLSRRSRERGFDGPLILCTGPILTAPGGYPTRAAWAPAGTGAEIAAPKDASEIVRRLSTEGAAAIKVALNPPVGPVFDAETLTAIVGAAHGARLKVTGHVYGTGELRKALACGMDELAHMLMSEEELDDETVAAMVAAGMTVVPTLSIRFGRDREIAIANLARFRAAGGRVVYGTDLGNEGPVPGIDRTEVTAMGAAGFSALEIVRTATVDAAAHLGLERKGAIDRGMDADVVAVPADALDDPALLSDVKMVWREGRRVA
ncbi:MAG TPA: amidohydrolase family protein [Actinomycetota bacterium]|nr:amidohydrolase family protein [Actinomycetota bacterium]